MHSDRTPARNPGGGTTTPASPWIGSISTATTRCPYARKASRSAGRSPYGTDTNPGVYGPKSARASGSEENDTIVVVRPWKFPSNTTMTASSCGTPRVTYPHLRATLIAVSTASAPVFIGSTISIEHSSASSAQNGPN